MEDERPIRDAMRRALEVEGFTVLAARDGADALAVLGGHPAATVDVVVTDVVMPEMSGYALVDQLRASRPGLRVLYMSGYPPEAIQAPEQRTPGAAFIPKPFTPPTLVRRVRELLSRPEA